MGTCQIACKQQSRSEFAVITDEVIDMEISIKLPKVVESVASEMNDESAPPFVKTKYIHATAQPNSNRFLQDIEDEVKRRIREIQIEELREKQAYFEQQLRAQKLAYLKEQRLKQVSPSNKDETTSVPEQKKKETEFNDTTHQSANRSASPQTEQQIPKKTSTFGQLESLKTKEGLKRSASVRQQSCQASQGSNELSLSDFSPKKGYKRALEKMASEYFYVEKGRENRFTRSQMSSYQKNKGILKYKTASVRNILLNRTHSSKTVKTQKTSNSKKVRFSKDTNFELERKQARQTKSLYSFF